MTKPKPGAIAGDKAVTVGLPAPLHRDFVAYSEVLARETGQPVISARPTLSFSDSRPRILMQNRTSSTCSNETILRAGFQ